MVVPFSHVPGHACVECGKMLDAATSIETNMHPKPGDITICIYCGNVMAFAEDLRLRHLTDAEMMAIAADPRILAIQKARTTLMKE